MPTAKEDFLSRILTLQQAIDIAAVTDGALTDHAHNNIARLLRNGLAVVGFAAIEDFIKKRSCEILSNIGPTGITFSQLPEKLQYAVTYESLKGLQFQIELFDNNSDKITYIQNEAKKISSTAGTPIELVSHAFAHDKSNVSHDTIKRLLLAFGIQDPWRQIGAISNQAGLTTGIIEQSYKNAALRRHKAAHVANASIPQGDIKGFIKEAIGVAIGYDALLSLAFAKIKQFDPAYITATTATLDASMIKYRFIKYANSEWREIKSGATRATSKNADKTIAIQNGIRSAHAHGELLVIYDEAGLVIDWHDWN